MMCGCGAAELGDRTIAEVKDGDLSAVHRLPNPPYPSCYIIRGETLIWVKR